MGFSDLISSFHLPLSIQAHQDFLQLELLLADFSLNPDGCDSWRCPLSSRVKAAATLAEAEAPAVWTASSLTGLRAGGRGYVETSPQCERLGMEAASYLHPKPPNMEAHGFDLEHAS